jgi:hypothetical protein
MLIAYCDACQSSVQATRGPWIGPRSPWQNSAGRKLCRRNNEVNALECDFESNDVPHNAWRDKPNFVRENPKFGIKAIQVRVGAEYTMRKGAAKPCW